MAIKLALLQDSQQVITDIRELVDDGKPIGYLVKNPHKVLTNQPFLYPEVGEDKDTSIEITLTPWILLTSDSQMIIPKNQIVTVVEPIDSLKEMYLEKINGSESNSTDK